MNNTINIKKYYKKKDKYYKNITKKKDKYYKTIIKKYLKKE